MSLLWFENLLLMRLWVWNAYLVLLWNRAKMCGRSLRDQTHCHACISAVLIVGPHPRGRRNNFDFHLLHFLFTIKVILCGQSKKHLVKIFSCGIQYNLFKHNNRPIPIHVYGDPRSRGKYNYKTRMSAIKWNDNTNIFRGHTHDLLHSQRKESQ